MIPEKFATLKTFVAAGCLMFATVMFAQDNGSKGNTPNKNDQQDSSAKKSKKSNRNAKKDNKSRQPMDEKTPLGPAQPGRMDTPTMPQRTPGQQPAPGSPDPTAPTTTSPR